MDSTNRDTQLLEGHIAKNLDLGQGRPTRESHIWLTLATETMNVITDQWNGRGMTVRVPHCLHHGIAEVVAVVVVVMTMTMKLIGREGFGVGKREEAVVVEGTLIGWDHMLHLPPTLPISGTKTEGTGIVAKIGATS